MIRGSRFLTALAIVQGLAALSAGATSALLVVLAERRMHVGPTHGSGSYSPRSVSALESGRWSSRQSRDARRPAFLFGPYLLRGLVDVVPATLRSYVVALGALAAYGVGTSTGNVTYHTALQTTVPDRLRGRVFAFYDIVCQSARLISIGVGGVLADAIGIESVYYVGGALLLLAGRLGMLRVGAEEVRLSVHPVDDAT